MPLFIVPIAKLVASPPLAQAKSGMMVCGAGGLPPVHRPVFREAIAPDMVLSDSQRACKATYALRRALGISTCVQRVSARCPRFLDIKPRVRKILYGLLSSSSLTIIF